MPKVKYRIKKGAVIYYKKRQVNAETLTDEIAKYLLSTGQYDNIIEVIEQKKKKESEE